MKACAIICEYNPFHSGHKYQIEETKKHLDADIYIGIMCNHFVQRGDIAIVSAKDRVNVALDNGLDLIVELPYPFSCQSADKYAYGAINIAKQLQVDYLSFGSESGDIHYLRSQIYKENPISKQDSLAKQNASYNSNDTLGIAYLKQLEDSSIIPYVVKRTCSYTSLTLGSYASASALRNEKDEEKRKPYTPLYSKMTNPTLDDIYPYIRMFLLMSPLETIRKMFLVEEGIENLFVKAAYTCSSLDDFLKQTTSKRYTTSRIRRTLVHIALQTNKIDCVHLEAIAPLRILGATRNGLDYIKEKKIEVVSKFNQLPLLYQQYIYKAIALIHSCNEEFEKEELQFPLIRKLTI